MQLCLSLPVGLKTAFSPPISSSSISCLSNHGLDSSRPRVSHEKDPKTVAAYIPRVAPQHFERLTAAQSMLAGLLLPAAAACTVLIACPAPVEAGIFSGSTGLESFQLPSIPGPEALKKIREANVEKYKTLDENFKKSPMLQELLKKSKENKEMHRKEIEDKYCLRGAEWGVGDCSLVGIPMSEREAFLERFRKGKDGG